MLGAGAALGVLEQAMRAALSSAGARLLEAVLAGEDGYAGPHAKCPDGHQAVYAGVTGQGRQHRARPGHGDAGLVSLRRSAAAGSPPATSSSGVAGTALSPGLAEMTALAGAEVSFARAAGLLSGLAGITLSAKTVERSAEASGASARAAAGAEAAAIRARAVVPLPPPGPVPDMLYARWTAPACPSAPARPRAARARARTGRPAPARSSSPVLHRVPPGRRRPPGDGPGSSSYVATFDGKDALARLVKAEYLRRGGGHFRQVVALGDGAAWIWNMAGDLDPHATHIVDIYHAREHLHDLAGHLAFITPDPPQWLAGRSAELDAGDIEAIIGAARAYPLEGARASDVEREAGDFEHNIHRMRYARFRRLGMFTGSGHIEAACK